MLSDYIPKKTYAIVAGYDGEDCVALVGGARLVEAYRIDIVFPKANPFRVGQKVTLHLDNRTGVESFDRDLRVYRSSVKAVVAGIEAERMVVAVAEYQVNYSNRIVERYKSESYEYPEDRRAATSHPGREREERPVFEDAEFENKLGVLVTRSVERPHTTVMAFLSTAKDEIFIISHEGTLKSRNLERDSRCCFAIDHRADYHFEKAYEWNYTIIKGLAEKVRKGTEDFALVQREFVRKNPWEMSFFSDPKVDMYRIEPLEILCPEKYRSCGDATLRPST